MEITRDSYDRWIGCDAVDMEGDDIGSITDIYYDNQTQRPEWVAIKTGLFGARHSFAPLAGAMVIEDGGDDGRLQLAVAKDQIKAAPNMDADGELTPDQEQTLYKHYGFDWHGTGQDRGFTTPTGRRFDAGYQTGWREEWNQRQGQHSGQRGGGEVVAETTATDQKVTTESHPVRMRKYQWTENVPVQREEVRVEGDDVRVESERSEGRLRR